MPRPADTLGQRLRLARDKRDLTQAGLAVAAGIKQSDVSKIESGRILQTTAIARLAAALRVPPLWLEIGDGAEPDWERSAQPHVTGLLNLQPIPDRLVIEAEQTVRAQQATLLERALPTALEALRHARPEIREELAQVLALLVRTGSDLYAKRVMELLALPDAPSGKRAA